eukprot:3940477-Rhodomonas_salina.1
MLSAPTPATYQYRDSRPTRVLCYLPPLSPAKSDHGTEVGFDHGTRLRTCCAISLRVCYAYATQCLVLSSRMADECASQRGRCPSVCYSPTPLIPYACGTELAYDAIPLPY